MSLGGQNVVRSVCSDLVDEPEVVADEHHAAVEVVDGVGECVDGLHVQMVGRLVQQQQVRGLVG